MANKNEIESGRDVKEVPSFVSLTVVRNSSFSFHTFTLCQLVSIANRTKAVHELCFTNAVDEISDKISLPETVTRQEKVAKSLNSIH